MGYSQSAVDLLHRAEAALLRARRGRRVIPASEVSLAALAQSPHATVELTDDQQRVLADIEHPQAAASR